MYLHPSFSKEQASTDQVQLATEPRHEIAIASQHLQRLQRPEPHIPIHQPRPAHSAQSMLAVRTYRSLVLEEGR
jgi:hypothetical protein